MLRFKNFNISLRKIYTFKINDALAFNQQLLCWLKTNAFFCVLNSNDYCQDKHGKYKLLVAVGCLKEYLVNENGFLSLRKIIDNQKDWLFGFLTYDLKNEIEDLHSNNHDELKFPLLHFFVPEYVFIITNNQMEIHYSTVKDESIAKNIYDKIINTNYTKSEKCNISIKKRISKKKYISSVSQLQKHIFRGDIYEVNFCQEFYAEHVTIDPFSLCMKLWQTSPMPFSVFYRCREKYLISASPERYLMKKNRKILSQPIKGTAKRSTNSYTDSKLKQQLKQSEKEKAENIMIVDLVRNDLSRIAKKHSINVEELCEIYSFANVHQMISTISATLKNNIDIVDAIKMTFPMGSMTGAPKIKAMEIIEKYETTKRGLYSGSVGYISPSKDFDFNVVIRSLLYNQAKKYLSFMVGSAITAQSKPTDEYIECLLKAKAMLSVLREE